MLRTRRSRLPVSLLLAGLLAACADTQPLTPALDPGDAVLARGPAAGFPVVQVLPNAPADAPGAAVRTLEAALERVRPGGTIRVHAGTYAFASLLIDKPVTIEGANRGRPPVLRILPPDGRPNVDIEITGVPGGTVTLRDLVVETESGAINAHGALGGLTVESVDIRMPVGGAGIGVFAIDTGPDADLRIVGSSITGGEVGAWISSSVPSVSSGRVRIEDSDFASFSLYGALLLGSDATVTGSTFADCGPYVCVRASRAVGRAEIVGNRFSDATTPEGRGFEDAFLHNLVEVAGGAQGSLRENSFDGCGHGQCVSFYNRASGEVVANRFTTYAEHGTRMVIVAADGSPGSIPEQGSHVAIRDNLITGQGATAADDERPGGYGVHLGAVWIEDGSTATATGNRVTNAFAAFVGHAGGRITGGSDNRADHVGYGVQAIDHGSVSLTRSDFSDYQTGVHIAWQPLGAPVNDLRCNWWSAGGPPSIEGPAEIVVATPFSATPIAGRPEVSCG